MRYCERWIFVGVLLLIPTLAYAEESTAKSNESASLPLWQAVTLGVVEGATEYLPVSSTGHLVIFQHLLGHRDAESQKEAADALAVCIQIGAILAVVFLYFDRLRQMVRGLCGGNPDGKRLAIHLVIAFIPAAVLGLLFGKMIKGHLLHIKPVTIAFFVGGLVILALGRIKNTNEDSSGKEMSDMTWRDALIVGLFQCIALWPGFSRSLATILGCRLVGLRMAASVEFSFLLGLITLTAATLKEGKDYGPTIIQQYGVVSPVISLIVAFGAAVLSVRFMVGTLNRFGLAPFGYYRLALAALCMTLWPRT